MLNFAFLKRIHQRVHRHDDGDGDAAAADAEDEHQNRLDQTREVSQGLVNLFLVEDQIGDGAGAGLLVEIILTFVLVFVVFATAIDPKGPAHIAPAAIGLAYLVDNLVGIPLTGASMNPARSFGPALVSGLWTAHWIYWVGPIVGAALAALLFEKALIGKEEKAQE